MKAEFLESDCQDGATRYWFNTEHVINKGSIYEETLTGEYGVVIRPGIDDCIVDSDGYGVRVEDAPNAYLSTLFDLVTSEMRAS